MHYQTSHHICQFSFLEITPRKKQLKHQLLHLTAGSLLMRLGQLEYIVNAPHLLWLPAHCLVSLTFVPNTQITSIEISTRVKKALPKAAGSIAMTDSVNDAFLAACLNKLGSLTFSTDDESLHLLYQVLLNEVEQQKPTLEGLAILDKSILDKEATVEQINLTDETIDLLKPVDRLNPVHLLQPMPLLTHCLQVREAIKLSQSGRRENEVLDSIFAGDHKLADEIFTQITGKSFSLFFQ